MTWLGQAAGTQKSCMVARLLERHSRGDNLYEDEEMLKDTMLTIYMGRFVSLSSSEILPMLEHESWSRNGQPTCSYYPAFLTHAVDACCENELHSSNGPLSSRASTGPRGD
jgi:hypothetical protein